LVFGNRQAGEPSHARARYSGLSDFLSIPATTCTGAFLRGRLEYRCPTRTVPIPKEVGLNTSFGKNGGSRLPGFPPAPRSPPCGTAVSKRVPHGKIPSTSFGQNRRNPLSKRPLGCAPSDSTRHPRPQPAHPDSLLDIAPLRRARQIAKEYSQAQFPGGNCNVLSVARTAAHNPFTGRSRTAALPLQTRSGARGRTDYRRPCSSPEGLSLPL